MFRVFVKRWGVRTLLRPGGRVLFRSREAARAAAMENLGVRPWDSPAALANFDRRVSVENWPQIDREAK